MPYSMVGLSLGIWKVVLSLHEKAFIVFRYLGAGIHSAVHVNGGSESLSELTNIRYSQ